MARVLNMAAKTFFACFCRLLKRGPRTTKWKNESLKMRSTVFSFEKTKRVWRRVEMIAWPIVAKRTATKQVIIFCSDFYLLSCFQCWFQELDKIRVKKLQAQQKNDKKTTILLFAQGQSREAQGKDQAARAELCRCRLFPPNENKENKTFTSAEPRILRKNNHDSKNTGGEMVNIGKFICISTLGSL